MVKSVLLAAVLAIAWTTSALADETDQFTLPDREKFTDIGPYVDLFHYRVLERVVNDVNARIERALHIPNERRRRATLERLHGPDLLADRARHYFGQGFVSVRLMEDAMHGEAGQQAFPDQLLAYSTEEWIYADTHFILDPRRIVLNFQGPTVLVHGVYFGIDKFGHAFDLGHLYFTSYRRGLRMGLTTDKAMERTLHIFSQGPVSELGFIGAIGTGVVSNADMASNYLGMKFYMNMTQPVMLKGEQHPPLLVRIGDFWALNHHVRPESGFMAPFYSDHLNEALNPCIYEAAMRSTIYEHLRNRADDILAFYADEDGNPRPREWFLQRYAELSTYYGENYGHYGIDPIATIANACFPEEETDRELSVSACQERTRLAADN